MKSPHEFPKAYTQAVRHANVDDYAHLYGENVRAFDHWDQWQMNGQKAFRDMAKEWFSSVGNEQIVVTFSDVEVTESSDLALLTCFVRFAGHDATGKQLRFLDERMTVGLRRQNSGEWIVIHQHTSAPTDPQTMKTKMVREP